MGKVVLLSILFCACTSQDYDWDYEEVLEDSIEPYVEESGDTEVPGAVPVSEFKWPKTDYDSDDRKFFFLDSDQVVLDDPLEEVIYNL